MRTIRGIDQLGGDAYPSAGPPHRTFQDIADAQFAADPFHIDGLTHVRKTGLAGDYDQPADSAERSNDLLDHSFREILLLRVPTHVGERQHRYGRLVGQRQWRRGSGWRTGGSAIPNPIDPHGPSNVL